MHSGIREGELPLLLLQQMKLFIKVFLSCKIAKPCKVTKTAAKTLMHHRTKKRICTKFARCKYIANMKFAKHCNQCKGGNGRICTKTGKFGHCHLCTGCKALQISYLQHICTRQIWGKFNFSSSAHFWGSNIFRVLILTIY